MRDEQLFYRQLRILSVLSTIIVVAYGVMALRFHSIWSGKMFACTLPLVLILYSARWLVSAGRFELGVALTGAAILLSCLLTAITVGVNNAVLGQILLWSVLVVVPHLQGELLIGFMIATVAECSCIGLLNYNLTTPTTLLSNSERLTDILGQTTVLGVTVLLLYQLVNQQKDVVSKALADKTALLASHDGRLESADKLAALEREKEIAIASARAKNRFVASVSHEIRTPMNAVLGMTGLLLDTVLNTTQRRFVETIRSSGGHLLAIINDILDFSKLDADALELEHSEFVLSSVVEETVELMLTGASSKGLEVCIHVAPETPPRFRGDAGRIRQVLLNLVGNAVKFTHQGEIVVSVQSRLLDSSKSEILFSVRDTGVGIPLDRRDRLFKPFSQVDASTNRSYGGTGLGLAICKRLVACMGGAMSVDSTPNVGSTFTFTIIVANVTSSQPVHQPPPQLRDKRALLVEDNRTSRALLRRTLESWGVHVDEAAEPARAVELSAKQRYDVVLIDHTLPQHDGVQLARQFRAQQGNSAAQMVLLRTLGVSLATADQTLFADHLYKPVRPTVLSEKLGRLFDPKLALPAPPVAPQAADNLLGKSHPLRILLAEDNPVNQRVAQLFLNKLGYRADVVANGQEALDAVLRNVYDVVFMDVQMPEMDGLTATARIVNSLPREARPLIVAMTAHAMAEDKARCLAAGMDEYMQKPINAAILVDVLRRAPRKQHTAAPPLHIQEVQAS